MVYFQQSAYEALFFFFFFKLENSLVILLQTGSDGFYYKFLQVGYNFLLLQDQS